MGKQFRSRKDLEGYMRKQLECVMDEVYDKLLDHLLIIIKRDVYDAYSPEFYERTEDLLQKENWKVKRSTRNGGVYRTLCFKDEELSTPNLSGGTHDPSSYRHGNYQEIFEPQNFIKMLNGDIDQGSAFGFPYVYRKPFWDEFMKYCDTYYPILFRNACKRYNVPLK